MNDLNESIGGIIVAGFGILFVAFLFFVFPASPGGKPMVDFQTVFSKVALPVFTCEQVDNDHAVMAGPNGERQTISLFGVQQPIVGQHYTIERLPVFKSGICRIVLEKI